MPRKPKAQQNARSKPKTKSPPRPPGRPPSVLEDRFRIMWEAAAAGTPHVPLLAEVTLPPRRYRFDFRIPLTNVLIEINGGTYARIRMGHSSGDGIARDYEKSRYAQMKGWRVFAYDRKQITEKNIQELLNYVLRTAANTPTPYS